MQTPRLSGHSRLSGPPGHHIFDCRVPLPYQLTPERYEAGDVAWMVDALHHGVDICGRHHGDWESMYGHLEEDG